MPYLVLSRRRDGCLDKGARKKMSKSQGVASTELIAACDESPNGLALARMVDSRWVPVDPSEVSRLRSCGEDPTLVSVEPSEGGGVWDVIAADDL